MITILRFSCLVWPSLLLVLLVIFLRPSARSVGAALVASLWNLSALLALHPLAYSMRWWTYEAEHGLILGMPGDLLLGWALLWGAIPILLFRRNPLWHPLVLFFLLDLLLMPACSPLIKLGPYWLIGELTVLVIALYPGLVLGRCIEENTSLMRRTILIVVGYTVLVLFVIPTFILEQSSSNWEPALKRPMFLSSFILICVLVAAIPALSAVQEFYERGQGTPLPFDPPHRFVTSGPYAYIANPMQMANMLVLLFWGWWTSSLWVAFVGLGTAACSSFIAAWHESIELDRRFGEVWAMYQAEVHNWIPRWRPRILIPCKLYVAQSCDPCARLGKWLGQRKLVGLDIIAAETHPTKNLRRMTYEAPGWTESGIRALARSLEHINLFWAWLSWMIRLPLISHVLQMLLDLSGGGPKMIPSWGR